VAPHARQYFWLAKRMTRDNDIARDLVHDAYATLFAMGNWRSISHPRAYVMRTIFTLGLKRIRRAKVVPMHGLPDFETLEFAAHVSDGFQSLSLREEMRIGLDAINSLPPMTRQVITLRRLEGLAIKEIAARLGLSVKGVDYHIARGAFLFTKAIEAANLKSCGEARDSNGLGND
jgi:RNA polymerase sigma-70 factor (ECF subfamily)